MSLTKVFEQVVLLSIMGSIFAIFILLIKTILRQKLSAKIHYYIWFLLILKLIVPLNFQSGLSQFNFISFEQQKINISSIVEQNFSSITDLKSNDNKIQDKNVTNNYRNSTEVYDRMGFDFKIGALIWIIGIIVILLYIIFVNIILSIRIKKLARCQRQDINEILDECKLRLKVSSKICLVYDEKLKSPAVYGVIRPKILISKQIIDKLSSKELKFVFLHEISHIKRKDLIVNMFITIIMVIYWFNPLVWYSLYQFKQDCEIACDATALDVLSMKEVKEYGQTIINMIEVLSEQNLISGALGFSSKYNRRRIIMISLFSKRSITWSVLALSLTLIVGCSSITKSLNDNKNSDLNKNEVSDSGKVKQNEVIDKSSSSDEIITDSKDNLNQQIKQNNSQNALLDSIRGLAKQGKIINCNFPAKSTVIEDIEKKWGKADKTDWVPKAKGTYVTYSKYNVVFGFNKGSQVFEVRSFDNRLKQISLSMVKNTFGTPEYNVKYNGEEIIGYTMGQEFKILFVFSQPTKGDNNPLMDHYSVLYPRGTVNNMADDPGRQW